ncbi:MAG: hypothetical protein AB7I38_16960 [Dehalococcoidia bacterium]
MAKNLDPGDVAASQEAAAEQISLQRVDDAAAVVRPAGVGQTWVEHEYDQLEAEQKPLWAASGTEESREAVLEAAGLDPAASAAERMLEGHTPVLEAAETRLVDTSEALTPFRRRPAKSKIWHYGAKGGFLIGDIAGISGASIMMGEIPALAFTMSASAAIATVVAGLTGTEVRDLRSSLRRQRDVDSLTDKQQVFQHLFAGVDDGKKYVRALIGVSVAVGSIIACSIFALRYSIEGPLVGLVYGGIAGAIAAASFIESYMYADEIADQIDNAQNDYDKELARHTKLAASAPWKQHAQRATEADSIQAEHTSRGQAAQDRLRALKFGILRRNPGVVGHGDHGETVGRTTRKGGAK